MKRTCIALCLWVAAAAWANDPKPLLGKWAEPIPSQCGLVLQFNADTVVHKLGELEYVTKVEYVPQGEGWLLKQTLQKHNGKKNCLGETAQDVAAHSRNGAYVVVKGGELTYFRSKDDKFSLRFRRN